MDYKNYLKSNLSKERVITDNFRLSSYLKYYLIHC